MRRRLKTQVILLLTALTGLTGCQPTQPFYLHETGDLSHYLDKATEIEHPDVDTPRLAEVDQAGAPLTVSNPEFHEVWELGLEECIHIAMQNSKVIRNAASIQANFGFSDALIERTAQLPTAYDAAITESRTTGGLKYNGRGPGGVNSFFSGSSSNAYGPGGPVRAESAGGVEDALSEFDAQFYSGYSFGTRDRPSNFFGFGGAFPPVTRTQDGSFEASVAKRSATGAFYRLSSKTDSNYQQQPLARQSGPTGTGRMAGGIFTTMLEAEARYPLMRGRGEQINRIPVVLARINTDISLADFESSVRNMLMDIENAYWDLYYSYRSLEAAKIGRDSAQATWRNVYEKKKLGTLADQDEAQSRGQYFQFRAAVENSLKELYSTENRLRWLMGLAASDGRLIRPKDEPTTARVEFEWLTIHNESLFRSTELRQQKWRIKQRELELISAKNSLLPWLSVSGVYRWLGVGDQLIDANRNGIDFIPPGGGNNPQGSTAFEEMTGGKYQEAFMQLDFLPPQFGARRELSAVRNAELQLARSKAHMEEMELNLSHLLTAAVRDLDGNYTVAQTYFNWWAAAQKEVEAFEALYLGGKSTLDLVLEAQRKRAQAQVQYYRSLTDYNKSLAMVHYRKGSLLEHNNVFLSEGPWPAKAYWDAIEKARERDAGHYIDYGWTRPRVVSRGPVEQHEGTSESGAHDASEPLPAPAPQPTEENPEAADLGPITQAGPVEPTPDAMFSGASESRVVRASYATPEPAAPVVNGSTARRKNVLR